MHRASSLFLGKKKRLVWRGEAAEAFFHSGQVIKTKPSFCTDTREASRECKNRQHRAARVGRGGGNEGPGAGTWDTSHLKLCSQSQQAKGLVPGLSPGRTRGVRQAVHARSVNAGGASAGLPSGARGAQGSHASGIRRASAALGTRLGSRLPGRYEFGNGKGTNIADGHYISEGCFVYTHTAPRVTWTRTTGSPHSSTVTWLSWTTHLAAGGLRRLDEATSYSGLQAIACEDYFVSGAEAGH